MRQAGFTLLELVMVLVIIGILVALGVPGFFKTVERSRMSEATRMLGVIRMAQMRYYAEHATFTSNMDELDIDKAEGKFFNLVDFSLSSGCTPGSNSCIIGLVERKTGSGAQNLYGKAYRLGMRPTGQICKSGDFPEELAGLYPDDC